MQMARVQHAVVTVVVPSSDWAYAELVAARIHVFCWIPVWHFSCRSTSSCQRHQVTTVLGVWSIQWPFPPHMEFILCGSDTCCRGRRLSGPMACRCLWLAMCSNGGCAARSCCWVCGFVMHGRCCKGNHNPRYNMLICFFLAVLLIYSTTPCRLVCG